MTVALTLLTFVLLAIPAPSQGAVAAARRPAEAADGLGWWTTHALDTVRPGARPPDRRARGRAVELAAARNEFEPFQLVLAAGERPVRAIDVTLTDLEEEGGPGRIPSGAGSVSIERWIRLETPSSASGEPGDWPDPLVPRVDAYAGERRNGFPFDLEPGRSQPLWIELYVPSGTDPGVYRGSVRISIAGAPRAAVPVRLRVHPFTLPSTSSLPNSYGFSGVSALARHRGGYTSDDDLFALTRVYAQAALRHRLSIHGGSMAPPETRFGPDGVEIDWARYDREVAPFLDGSIFGAGEALPGARWTSVDLRTPAELPDARRILYWRAWADHFRARGWLDRLFVYVMDEPEGPEDYRRVLHLARLARRADPDLRTLLTEQRVPALAGWIDLWVPLANCLEDPPGREGPCEETVPRAAYRSSARAAGAGGPWWYQSCVSHGCDEVGGPASDGWPSYVIDAPPVASRIFPWLAWRYRIAGELYYNTVEAYGAEADPWSQVRTHGGNGDGTLFYPGTPARIGGRTDVPIESLRLKRIREGLEDYEYFVLAARAGAGERADELVRALAPRVWDWNPDPEALYAAREELADLIGAHPHGNGSSRSHLEPAGSRPGARP